MIRFEHLETESWKQVWSAK